MSSQTPARFQGACSLVAHAFTPFVASLPLGAVRVVAAGRHHVGRIMIALALLSSLSLMFIQGTPASAAAPSWSSPSEIAPTVHLNSVSCPSGTFCAAVDTRGRALTDHGSSSLVKSSAQRKGKGTTKGKSKASGKSPGRTSVGAGAVNAAKFCPDWANVAIALSTDSMITGNGTLDMSDAGTVHDLQNAFRTLLKDTSNGKLRNSLNKALRILKPIAAEAEDSNGNVNVSNSQATAMLHSINPLIAELNSINQSACASTG